MNIILPPKSLRMMVGVHADLRHVVSLAYVRARKDGADFIVTCGVRSMTEQKRLLRIRATTTLRSRHVVENNKCGVGCAVDLAYLDKGKVRWDWPLYHVLAKHMKAAANVAGVPLEWGGDWRTFKDGPHFQLPWKGKYA